jgi:thiopeptide-type bacteriocin biosynthesis protein
LGEFAAQWVRIVDDVKERGMGNGISNGDGAFGVKILDRFMLRVPSRPVAASRPGETVAAGREWIRKAIADPMVREAVTLASADLFRGEAHWIADPDSKKGRRFELAMTRYLERMACRAVPFGLFAGVAVGKMAGGAKPEAPAGRHCGHARTVRPDAAWLEWAQERAMELEGVRRGLKYQANPTIHKVGAHFVYAWTTPDGGEAREGHAYRTRRIEANAALEQTLELTRNPLLYGEIVNGLLDDGDDPADAMGFLDELIANGVLVPDFGRVVCGDAVRDLVATLERSGEAGALFARGLEPALKAIAGLAKEAQGRGVVAYEDALATGGEMFAGWRVDNAFQVDAVADVQGLVLDEDEVRGLLDRVNRVLALLDRGMRDRHPLAKFAERFQARFEDGSVPLLQAVDEDFGLGNGILPDGSVRPTLLDGMPAAQRSVTTRKDVRPMDRWLFDLARKAERDGLATVELDLRELALAAGVRPGEVVNPDGCTGVALVQHTLEGWVFCGHWYAHYGNPLSRFSHLGADFHALIKDSVSMGWDRDDEIAEIVHHPGGRPGNVCGRLACGKRGIALMGRSADSMEMLRLDDLLVSCENGKVILRNVLDGRKVIPRHMSVHMDSALGGLGPYAFLVAAGRESRISGWSWGRLGELLTVMPRVTHEGVILAPQRWQIGIEGMPKAQAGQEAREAWFGRIVAKYSLPDKFLWRENDSDRILPVALGSPLSVSAFLGAIRDWERTLTLDEWLEPAPTVTDAQGNPYRCEFAIPFGIPDPTPVKVGDPKADVITRPRGERAFPPGSEWGYIKAYGREMAQDALARGLFVDTFPEAMARGLVDRAFFVRYQDADGPHLRIRYRMAPGTDQGGFTNQILRLASGLSPCSMPPRIVMDTYVREIERYGGSAEWMDLAERVFTADSLALAKLAATLDRENAPDAVPGIILGYLEACGLAGDGARNFVDAAAEGYGLEFGLESDEGKAWLGRFIRKRRSDGAARLGIAEKGRLAVKNALGNLLPEIDSAKQGLVGAWPDVVGAYIHMSVNRFLASDQRLCEGLGYHVLSKELASEAARGLPRG